MRLRIVRPERTHRRDLSLSERHRAWGYDLPCLDLDLLLVEYDNAIPVGIVEYKNEHSYKKYTSHSTWRALQRLADRAELPLFRVIYSSDFTKWQVKAMNRLAKEHVPQPVEMTEAEFVQLLYNLRGREVPQEILANLQTKRGDACAGGNL